MGARQTGGRTRRRKILLWTVFPVVVLAVAAAATITIALRMDSRELPAGFPQRPAPIALTPQFSPAYSGTGQAPSGVGVQQEIADVLDNPDLGELTGQITDAVSGAVLWSLEPDKPRTPASNIKLATASAALLAVPHDQRLRTTVVAGPNGQVILTGAGDITMSAQPADVDTLYTDPARISELADQIRAAGIPVESVAVDLGAFSGPTMNDTWSDSDIGGGDITPIEPLMLDGGRSDPLDNYSPRTAEPGLVAGRALAQALGVDGDVTVASAPTGAAEVAAVESQPLVTRVNDMLRLSDNVLAETLSIELSVARGGPASLAGGTDAIVATLVEHGIDLGPSVVYDASGLSHANRLTARVLDRLISAAAASGRDSLPQTRSILDGLPIAGGTGTLTDRFDAPDDGAAGWVRAKTGTLTGVSSLTGIVQTVQGRILAFALMSGGTSPADARPALDAIPGKLRECGCH